MDFSWNPGKKTVAEMPQAMPQVMPQAMPQMHMRVVATALQCCQSAAAEFCRSVIHFQRSVRRLQGSSGMAAENSEKCKTASESSGRASENSDKCKTASEKLRINLENIC